MDKLTLLDIEPEHLFFALKVDDFGEGVVRVEGELHPRVGTNVKDLKEVIDLPEDTIVEVNEFEHTYLSVAGLDSWNYTTSTKPLRRENTPNELIIGAKILYIPPDSGFPTQLEQIKK